MYKSENESSTSSLPRSLAGPSMDPCHFVAELVIGRGFVDFDEPMWGRFASLPTANGIAHVLMKLGRPRWLNVRASLPRAIKREIPSTSMGPEVVRKRIRQPEGLERDVGWSQDVWDLNGSMPSHQHPPKQKVLVVVHQAACTGGSPCTQFFAIWWWDLASVWSLPSSSPSHSMSASLRRVHQTLPSWSLIKRDHCLIQSGVTPTRMRASDPFFS